LVQRAFGQSLGFGEVKLGGNNITNHSLLLGHAQACRLIAQKCFEVWPSYFHFFKLMGRRKILLQCFWIITISQYFVEYQLVFYTTKIDRIALPEALSCLHSFILLKIICMLLRVTRLF